MHDTTNLLNTRATDLMEFASLSTYIPYLGSWGRRSNIPNFRACTRAGRQHLPCSSLSCPIMAGLKSSYLVAADLRSKYYIDITTSNVPPW